jgi:hypothetical protein
MGPKVLIHEKKTKRMRIVRPSVVTGLFLLAGTLATVQWDEKIEEKGGSVGKIVVVLDSTGEEVRIAKDKCDLIPDGGGLAETLKRVRIHSLKQSSHLNGRFGTVRFDQFCGTNSRVLV